MTLFGTIEPPVDPPARLAALAVRYVNATSNARCDHCARALIEHDGAGPLARTARVKRVDVDGAVVFLCYAHAQQIRDIESLVDRKVASRG